MALLSFLGAIQEVTGSCYLVETRDGSRVLLECGMRQGGRREEEEVNARPFPFDPGSLNAVVISHAHIDHSGLLPRLAAAGYRGPIFATEATCELMDLMLLDAAHLQENDAAWENKWRARLGKSPVQPLYTTADAEKALSLCRPQPYGTPLEVAPGVIVTFHQAGHILGSAIVEMELHDHHLTRHLVFSGDLGNTCTPLMRDPTPLSRADLVLLESTYGDRDHRNSEETLEEFAEILQKAHRDGGNVLIPSFAVGRTQDLLFYLGRFYQEGRLPQQAVFLDSPMAIRANAIYSHFAEEFDPVDRSLLQAKGVKRAEDWLPILRTTPTPEESMAINRIKSGAIIIAGSGMCTGGRIVHHFKHNLWRQECHLVFPGFQAQGTLGRRIVDGASNVKVLHQRIAVRAQVHTLGGFSAHAGQSQLIDWVRHFDHRPELYLVHGEREKMQVLQQVLHERLNWTATIPERGEQIAI
ncbi:MBL fold metallo-hydrolase RNA specificity domain-containing protein [Azotobacter salinestris]|uniref:MBL fold metallo-hydrolase RNA specificity domain-containing protein n=1 Tax=Azotobacter salinestris TaxID=69964 RepID=UPI001266C28B|nr:MBL fold metallo-hydrolase [Azotobacter salinestris]